jgi:hypothetical protein
VFFPVGFVRQCKYLNNVVAQDHRTVKKAFCRDTCVELNHLDHVGWPTGIHFSDNPYIVHDSRARGSTSCLPTISD